MAETLSFSANAGKETIYNELMPQVEALLGGESDLIANLANVSAVLKQAFDLFWVGFYLVKGGQLVLGPFQGPLACTRIGLDQGVCGHAYTTRQTVIVPDVDQFSGHIACSSASRSEIVVPIFDGRGGVAAVLDADSDQLNHFDRTDADGLGRIARLVERSIISSAVAAV